MGPRLCPGISFGYRRGANTYVVGLANGEMVEPRAVTRRPMEDRWNLDDAKNVKATPWDLLQRFDVETVLKQMAETLDELADKEFRGQRRFKITRRDVSNPPVGRGPPEDASSASTFSRKVEVVEAYNTANVAGQER